MHVSGYLCAHMYTRVCTAWVRVHVRAGVTGGGIEVESPRASLRFSVVIYCVERISESHT